MRRRKIWGAVVIVAIIGALGGGLWWVLRPAPAANRVQANLTGALSAESSVGYRQATEQRPFRFPADHGAHPDYQTEWWYYTGNLSSADGRSWGYQLTFFRQGLAAQPISRTSEWATQDVYFAHFTVSDIAAEQFYAFERISRGGEAGLAGASGDPYQLFIENWSAKGTGSQVQLVAAAENISITLDLTASRPPTLQGQSGLSPKSYEPNKASYYYSLTNLATSGTISIAGQPVAVTGTSWFDHEWATSSLASQQVGWQWFGLHLDDGRDLMWGQLRRSDGSFDYGFGSITSPTDPQSEYSSAQILGPQDATLTALDTWKSQATGFIYPARWRLQIPSANLDLTIEPQLNDQELRLQAIVYWEGAVSVSGSATGRGYAELTGYGGDGQPLR